MNFLKETLSRLKAESPSYFNDFRRFGDWLTGTGLGLVGIPAVIEQMVPQWDFDLTLLVKISSYMVLAGIIISRMAKLPVSDPKDIK